MNRSGQQSLRQNRLLSVCFLFLFSSNIMSHESASQWMWWALAIAVGFTVKPNNSKYVQVHHKLVMRISFMSTMRFFFFSRQNKNMVKLCKWYTTFDVMIVCANAQPNNNYNNTAPAVRRTIFIVFLHFKANWPIPFSFCYCTFWHAHIRTHSYMVANELARCNFQNVSPQYW